ncbi:MAG TPA: hypothetical protein DEA08_18325 [Planctomycetes bacterium]|nr:hypothetical protein [Planctomycetota bacterium]
MNSGHEDERAAVSEENAEFWDELCGTGFAKSLGLGHEKPSSEALARFDAAYLDYYPYLGRYLAGPFAGQRVLEIGLGYGTVGQLLSEAGADYLGMDLARNAVRLLNHRRQLLGLRPSGFVANALRIPLADGSLDAVVSIGCLHHTGNLGQALSEVYRVLRPGGLALIMVYNRYSWRRWSRWPRAALGDLARELPLAGRLFRPRRDNASADERLAYDFHAADDDAPPFTEFASRRSLRRLLSRFSQVEVRAENSDALRVRLPPLFLTYAQDHFELVRSVTFDRMRMLRVVRRTGLGLDLYVTARK